MMMSTECRVFCISRDAPQTPRPFGAPTKRWGGWSASAVDQCPRASQGAQHRLKRCDDHKAKKHRVNEPEICGYENHDIVGLALSMNYSSHMGMYKGNAEKSNSDIEQTKNQSKPYGAQTV
jgi:hypothetical protein